jgi:hypothetical protein
MFLRLWKYILNGRGASGVLGIARSDDDMKREVEIYILYKTCLASLR